MIMLKSQFAQQVLAVITLLLVLAALSIIWPMIIAVFLSILLLLRSLGTELEIVIVA